jgi:hypothetical protein
MAAEFDPAAAGFDQGGRGPLEAAGHGRRAMRQVAGKEKAMERGMLELCP